MAKLQVKGSKTAKKKPPFQHGNGGSIIEFTHQCAGGFAVALVRNETQRHSAALKSAGQNPASLLPLNRCIARFHVVSRAGELGLPLLSHLENRVVTM